MNKTFLKLTNVSPWHFLWIGILVAELFTALCSYIFCTLWYGSVPEKIFPVGIVDSFIVSVIVCWVIIFFLGKIQRANLLNAQLSQEIEYRKKTEQALQDVQGELEQRIVQRTRALAQANTELRAEIDERKRATEKAVVMEERGRLARELHDSVSQSLYSVTLFAETGRQLAMAGDESGLRSCLDELNQSAQGVLKEFRLLVYDLRPSTLEEEGLAGALKLRLEAVEQRAGVKGDLVVEQVGVLPSNIEEGLYRIAQEALNNALKHSCATQVAVRLTINTGRTEMAVQDNGIGFDLEQASGHGGMGLRNMGERAERLGGRLVVHSGPDQGTLVEIVLTGS